MNEILCIVRTQGNREHRVTTTTGITISGKTVSMNIYLLTPKFEQFLMEIDDIIPDIRFDKIVRSGTR